MLAVVAAAGLSCGDDGFTTAGPEGGVVSVRIAQRELTMVMGDTVVMSAVGFDRELSAISGRTPNWTSTNTAVVSIDERSVLRAHTAGSAMVIAEIDGMVDTAKVSVIEPPVALVRVAPSASTVILTQQKLLVATTWDVRDSLLVGRPIAWSSDDETVATVDAGGMVTTRALGTAAITATSEGHSASATITVVPVPVKAVEVAPNPAVVQLGGTLALTAIARDSVGGALAGREVAWSSTDEAIVTVTASGQLAGLAIGSASVRATSEGVTTTVPVTVAAPSIALSSPTATFSARHTAASPASQTIAVTNGGAFTLDGLTATTEYAAGEPTGWLAATLNQAAAPATLTLAATTSALAPETYHATVTIASPVVGVAARTVEVTLVVTPFPVIGLGGTTLAFAAQAGAANPAAQTVAITNDGSGALVGLAATVAYGAGQPTGWLGTALDATTAPATLTVNASASIAPGSYTATITLASTNAEVATKTIAVTYAVSQPASIATSSASASFAAQVGAASPAAQVLNVTNGGSGVLTGLSASVAYAAGQPTGWLAAALGGTSAATTLTLTPTTTPLAAGTYEATVTLASTMPGVAAKQVAVTAVVSQTAVLAVSSSALTFASASGGAAGAAQTVNVTNSGTGVLAGLSTSIAYASGQPTGWLAASLDATTAPAVLSVTATAGALPLGTYDATITVASSAPGIASQLITVAFTVSDGAVIGLSTNTASASAQLNGADPAAANVAVSSLGVVPASGLSVSVAYGAGASGWLDASLGAATAPTALTLQPHVAGLAIGTYTATATVSSSLPNVTPRAVTFTLTVAQTASIALSSTARAFTAASGGASPAAQTVSITNGGTGTLSGLSASVTACSSSPCWIAASLGGVTTAPSTLTLTPSTSALAAGSYTATVTVASSLTGVASRTVTLSLTVTAGAAIGVSTNAITPSAQVNGADPAADVVAISSAGAVPLTGLSIAKLRASAWLDASLSGAAAPATLTLQPHVAGLAIGTYRDTVVISSSLPSVKPESVTVTFTVSQTASIGVSATTRSFTALSGAAASPAPQMINVTNAGTGTLSGLAASVTNYGGGSPGWLAASLDVTSAPATLTITPTLGTLAPGTYTADVVVSSSLTGVAARTIAVTFTVSQGASIGLATTGVSLLRQQSDATVATQSVAVTNAGTPGSSLTGLSVSKSAGAAWLTVSLVGGTTAPTSVKLDAAVGALATGTYNATVTVSSLLGGVTARTINVTFTVADGAAIGLTTSDVAATVQPGAAPSFGTVTITNEGPGGASAIAGLPASPSITYTGGATTGWLAASISPSATPSTLTLTPTGVASTLAIGTYTADVTITSTTPNVASRTVTVTLTVAQSASIALSATSRSFSANSGVGNPASQTVTVTNGGTGTLDQLVVRSVVYGPTASGWLTTASLNTTSAPAVLTLQPTTGSLPLGTHTATVTLGSNRAGVADQAVSVSFTVAAGPSIAVAAPSVGFTAQVGGGNPSEQTVAVTNGSGIGTLSGLTVQSVTYGVGASGWLTVATLDAATAPTTLRLRPTTGALAIGSYSATVTLASSLPNVATRTVTVSFTVSQTASIALSANSRTFSAARSSTAPASQTVNVTNGGTGTLDQLTASIAYAGGEPTGWLTTASLNTTTAPAVLTLQPSTGALAVGTYHATVTIGSTRAGVTSQTVDVTFSVTAGAAIALGSSTASFSAQVAQANPASQDVAITNGGASTLSGLSASIAYTGGGSPGWLAATFVSGVTTAPTAIRLQPTTGALAAGTYTANVTIQSSLPNVSSQVIAVTFTVSQTASIALGATSRSFTAQVQQANPAEQTVAVTNGGTGVLDGLSVSGISYGPGATGWLTATLDAATAATTLRLQPATGALAAGSYTAQVTIASSRPGITSKTVDVTFTVSQTASITLGSAPTFNAQLSGSAPTNQTVSVSNGGTGVLDGLSVTGVVYAVVSGTPGATGWLTTQSLGATTAPTNLTVGVTQGALAIGTYTATVTVGSSRPGIAAKQVVVTMNVVQNAVLSLTPNSWTPSLQASAASPAAQAVSVTNSGSGGTIAGLAQSISYGASEPTGWLSASFAGGVTTAPTTLNLSASAASLAAGTYHATVTVTSTTSGVTSKTVTVTLTVTTAPVINASPTSRSYTVTRGSNPSSQAVTITNTGGGTLSGLSATLISGGAGWLDGAGALSLNTTTAPATLTISPTTSGLSSSPSNATVRIASSVPGVAAVDVTVSVTVQQPVLALDGVAGNNTDALGSITRGNAPVGGAARTVAVTNSGAGTLNGLSVGTVSYSATGATGWLSGVSVGGTAPTNVSYTVNTNVAAGSHTASFTVSSTVPGVTARTITVSMTILQPQIGLTATSYSQTLRVGVNPTDRSVTVSNSGSGSLTNLTIEAITYSGASGWVSPSVAVGVNITPGSSVSFTTSSVSTYGNHVATIRFGSTQAGVNDQTLTITLNNRWAFADIQPTLTSNSCTLACHTQDLSVYTNLVGQAATYSSCASPSRIRVVAGNSSTSLLYQKVAGTHSCGVRMPDGGPYLDATTLAKIRDWIDGGALNTVP